MEFLIPQVYQMKELILKRNLLSYIFKYYKKTQPQIVSVQRALFGLR